MLHPFREGNGRTIRIFIYLFELRRGITWQYERMNRENYIQAMIKAVTDTNILQKLFLETIKYTKEVK